MIEILVISGLLGFLTVLLGTPLAEKYLSASGILGIDQQKSGRPRVPTSGGTIVLLGFILSVSFYAGSTSLFTNIVLDKALVFAAMTSVALITLIGLIDDIHVDLAQVIGEEFERDMIVSENRTIIHEKADMVFGTPQKKLDRTGLSQVAKMLMVLPAAFPLIAVGAGSWTMTLPVIGVINWGLVYPLLLLPLGLIFVSNVVNMLAGVNGLETGLSIVASTALGVYAFQNGMFEALVITFMLSSSLMAFYIFNNYPASILPGDSLTYLAGAAMFSAIVIGDMEVFGAVLFLPWMIEFVLKARSKFNAHSWGELEEDGTIKPVHTQVYSIIHILMRKNLNEKQIAQALILLMIVWSTITLVLFNYVPALKP